MHRLVLIIAFISLSHFVFSITKSGFVFKENKGQIIDQENKLIPDVKFLFHSPGFNVQLRQNGFSYDLYEKSDSNHIFFHRIDFDFPGSNPDIKIIAEDPDASKENYYTTGTPENGLTGVRSFKKIIYQDFYPNIDLEFSGSDNHFKYNFVLRNGADVSVIRFNVNGSLSITQKDDCLEIETAFGMIKERIPESFYTKGKDTTSYTVHFLSLGDNYFTYKSEGIIPLYTSLIIDPVPERLWGTYYGGDNYEFPTFCRADIAGYVYLGGRSASLSNIATSGAYQTTLAGGDDGYFAKFDSLGNRIWATYYGGSLVDIIQSISLKNNILIISGKTSSPNGIATVNAYQSVLGSINGDCFVARFDTSGIRVWGTYYGGDNFEDNGVTTIDENNNIYLMGITSSTSGIATPGSHQSIYGGGPTDGFLVKFDENGNRLWATYYGGSGQEYGTDIICFNNDLFFCGSTNSPNNISTLGSYQPNNAGTVDGYLVKFSQNGVRIWGSFLGGSDIDYLQSIKRSVDGCLYVSGNSKSTGLASPGSFQPILNGMEDLILSKFDNLGNHIWTTYVGGEQSEGNSCIDIDNNQYIYISGITTSNSGIATTGAFQSNHAGGIWDGFLMKFDSAGNRIWGTYYGGEADDRLDNCSLANNFLYIGGHTFSLTGIATPGSYQQTLKGSYDAFLVQFNICLLPDSARLISGPDSVCLPATGVVYSVPPISHALTYNWNTPPGTIITSGSNTNTITIDYPLSATNGHISVYGVNSCGIGDSSFIPVTFTPSASISLSIAASSNNICSGTSVTFTATPTGTGTLTYDWKVNGLSQGVNNPIFNFTPANGDVVTCVLSSSITTCVTNNPATSNAITMVVNPPVPVAVNIAASQNPVCLGSSVTFTASQTVPGNLSYQWFVNGNPVGTNSSIYSYTPSNNDAVHCSLLTDHQCSTNNPAISNIITMNVTANVAVAVSINASTNPICGLLPVTFTATQSIPGNLTYQWFVNGNPVGTNSSNYTFTPSNNDAVHCSLFTDHQCTTNNPANSNTITMSIIPAPVVSYTICTDSITTTNARPIKLKGGIPLGGTYSGPGVNSLTGVFSPAIAGVGTKAITYTYTNAGLCSANKTKNIIVQAPAAFTCGNTFTDIRDNMVYQTIQIGAQCWFAEDLAYGTSIPQTTHQSDNCVVEKYQSAVSSLQSAVYQWDEMMAFNQTAGEQGICPPSWHVPTETEWQILFNNYGGIAFSGSPLKYSGFSGFNAMLNGFVPHNTTLLLYHFATFYWTSTAYGPYKAWAHGMNEPDPSVSSYPAARQDAFGVRCVKD